MSEPLPHPITVLRHSATKQIAQAQSAGAAVLDVTSHGPEPWIQFSPFYPHRMIPIPMSDGYFTACVEGAWQGLKVFESEGIDRSKFRVVDMKGLKRTVRKYGRVRGHQAGVESPSLLAYVEARRELYLPMYHWVLEHKVAPLLGQIRQILADKPVVLLDYETNADVFDPAAPLSHAQLIKAYLEDQWPG